MTGDKFADSELHNWNRSLDTVVHDSIATFRLVQSMGWGKGSGPDDRWVKTFY